MQKTYEPQSIEAHWTDFWENQGLNVARGQGPSYSIMLPPPNVTGSLHMGHGFQQTLMDALIRYHRMLGDNTLWQVGVDHAGIATQMVVERQLEAKGQSRHDLGREAFINKVWEWKEESGSTIMRQIRRLGASADWQREHFTMDPAFSHATQEAFIRLYRDGLIYRGQRLVNWDPKLKTAISDLEVVSEDASAKLYYIRYPLAKGQGHLTVATSRPETLFGDVAVAVNPKDPRYKNLIGQTLLLPFAEREIPIIADESVLTDFGTGCVKITPAHDFNDNAMGQRHQLPMINILTEDAHLNENVPQNFRGLERFAARKKVISELELLGLVEKIEDYQTKIPRSSRSEVIVEPYLTYQWFVKTEPLAKPALAAVRDGRIKFIPENWENTYFAWLENIQDWCISRQLWWGHRIPAWFDQAKNIYVGHSEAEVRAHYQLDADCQLEQETDVLDTWFSSALWPFATLGWPENTAELKTFYPSSVLVTGFDIIFFWVARMVMFGLKFMNDVPFKELYITGLIRDSQGQKMSKSKANVLDPLDLIDGITLDELLIKRTGSLMQPEMRESIVMATRKEFAEGIKAYGTDALRFTFCALASTGRNINFDMQRLEGYRNFCTKIWNAARFVLMHTENKDLDAQDTNEYSIADRWIRNQLQNTIQKVHKYFKEYRFDLLAQCLHEFIWNEYCDWYLEFAKVTLNNPSASAADLAGTRRNLIEVLETILRLIHPLMPFISEEIWHTVAPLLKLNNKALMLESYPLYDAQQLNSDAENSIAWLKHVIEAVRNMRGEMNIAPSVKLTLILSKGTEIDQKLLNECRVYLTQLARLHSVEWQYEDLKLEKTAKTLIGKMELDIPLTGIVDLEAEKARLNKEIEKRNLEHTKLAQKLANEHYVNKAPAAVVEADRQRLAELSESLNQLKMSLAKIK